MILSSAMAHFNIIGFVLFGLVAMMTPGPNNYILFSYGKLYGFKGAYKTMLGIFFGFMSILFITGYGVAEIMTKNATIAMVLKIASSLWLLYLAFSLSNLDATNTESLKKKVGFPQMFLMQFVNPKAWIIAIAGASAFMPSYDSIHTNVMIYAIGFPVVGIVCMLSWLSFGEVFSKLLKSKRANKITGLVLASLLVLSIILMWIKG